MTTSSIIIRNSSQPIALADVRQLHDAIVGSARAELRDILDHVKQAKAPTGARARAVVQAVQQLPERMRDALVAGRAGLGGQVGALPKRTSPLNALRAGVVSGAAAAAAFTKLSMRVQKIQCVTDTRELGKDEMLLGGQATVIPLSADGTFGQATDAGTTAPIALGKFKGGEQKSVEIVLSSFSLRDALPFPRVFNVSMLLVEHDLGDPAKLVTLLKTIETLVEDKVVEKVQEFLTGLDDDKKFGALIALAVTLVPSVLAALISAVGKLVGDEQFPLFAAAVAMESPDALFDGGKQDSADQVAQFSAFGGTYKLTYDFALS